MDVSELRRLVADVEHAFDAASITMGYFRLRDVVEALKEFAEDAEDVAAAKAATAEPGDPISLESVVGELKAYDAPLDVILAAASKHDVIVTFTPARFD